MRARLDIVERAKLKAKLGVGSTVERLRDVSD
jgi:hypothetical protein